jgi:streptogramin lyase
VELLASEWNIHYPILLDPYHVAVSQYVKPRLAIPATIIIDAKGKIYFESIGYDKKTIPRIEKVLRKL